MKSQENLLEVADRKLMGAEIEILNNLKEKEGSLNADVSKYTLLKIAESLLYSKFLYISSIPIFFPFN